ATSDELGGFRRRVRSTPLFLDGRGQRPVRAMSGCAFPFILAWPVFIVLICAASKSTDIDVDTVHCAVACGCGTLWSSLHPAPLRRGFFHGRLAGGWFRAYPLQVLNGHLAMISCRDET